MSPRTEKEVREALTAANYQSFLNTNYPKTVAKHEETYWNPETGSCGFHARFTYEALGVKGSGDYDLVKLKDIEKVLAALDKGEVVGFLHSYPNDAKYFDIPKDNRYGNHVFALVKGGDKYFLSQGYLHKYRHSLTTFTRSEVAKMLEDIITKHSDYEDTKTWGDIDLDLHTKYFKVEARVFPDKPFIRTRKMNGIKLFMEKTKPI
jgi:hypothetical protein